MVMHHLHDSFAGLSDALSKRKTASFPERPSSSALRQNQFGLDTGFERLLPLKIPLHDPTFGFQKKFLVLLPHHADSGVIFQFGNIVESEQKIVASGLLAVDLSAGDQGEGQTVLQDHDSARRIGGGKQHQSGFGHFAGDIEKGTDANPIGPESCPESHSAFVKSIQPFCQIRLFHDGSAGNYSQIASCLDHQP